MTELRDSLDKIGRSNPTNAATFGRAVFDWIVTATQEIERLQANMAMVVAAIVNDESGKRK